jgi:steroid 5-alpha reductase family enzyme
MIALALAWFGLALVFAGVWAFSWKWGNYGLLDVIWSYSVALVVPCYLFFGQTGGDAKFALCFVGLLWSLRLGTTILRRVRHHHPQEDARYATLRERWPTPRHFLAFFQIQAAVAAWFTIPFWFACFGEGTGESWTLAGAALAALALVGEAIADAQLARFKSNPANRGKVCEIGLWRYSRHPNYFFEALVWVGFALSALGHSWGWVVVTCPLLMLYFLLCVTGIPLTEAHSLRSRGEAYRAYQRRTSAFIPWFPKSDPPHEH